MGEKKKNKKKHTYRKTIISANIISRTISLTVIEIPYMIAIFNTVKHISFKSINSEETQYKNINSLKITTKCIKTTKL